MVCVTLICSDGDCDAYYRAWCRPEELDRFACEFCGCSLQVICFETAEDDCAPRSPHLQLSEAA